MHKAITYILAASLTLLAAADETVTGKWQGSNGRTFVVPTSQGRFNLTTIEANGDRKVFPANWDQPEKSFTWTDANQSKHSAVFERNHKPVRFRDVGEAYPDSPGYWYRPGDLAR